jgi:hypothetical protein
MDNTSYTVRVPKRWARLSLVVVVTALIVAPLAAVATHTFTDVPNDHTFHNDIAWLAANDVTRGCNPPQNNLYCPHDDVTRAQMAAFMRRLADTFGVAEDSASNNVNLTTTDLVEVLSIEVDPKFEADVLLNAHASFTKGATDGGLYTAQIRRGSCNGAQIATGMWGVSDGADIGTISVTAADVVSSATTYKLCVNKVDLIGTSPNAIVSFRGLTAAWSPTTTAP